MAFDATQQLVRVHDAVLVSHRTILVRPTLSVERLFELLETVWGDARAGRAMPKRTDISPAKLKDCLPYVALLDVVPGDPVDFRYRLLGQQLINGFGQNITGRLHTQHADPSSAIWPFYDAYRRCVATRLAQKIDHEFRNHNRTLVRVRSLVLPLSDDDEAVTGLLGAGMFVEPAFR